MRVTAKQVLELIGRLPDADSHIYIDRINGKHCVTSEWIVGSFAGRAFEANSYSAATRKLIRYMYGHIGHISMVGKLVTESGFPDLEKVYEYCIARANAPDKTTTEDTTQKLRP